MAAQVTRIIFFLLLFKNLMAQDPAKPFIHKNLTRATLTFGTGYMPQSDLTNVYLCSDLEYYTGNKISLRGENFIFLNSLNKERNLIINNGIFAGPLYHVTTGSHFDPYMGILTGLSLTETQEKSTLDPNYFIRSGYGYNPLFSVLAGFNYYATRYFHLFINGRWVGGTHLSRTNTPFSLNEFRFSFGLGFNVF
jgi:hypothetical protein